jgi:hypothetical protein
LLHQNRIRGSGMLPRGPVREWIRRLALVLMGIAIVSAAANTGIAVFAGVRSAARFTVDKGVATPSSQVRPRSAGG